MAKVLGVSRSGYYRYLHHKPSRREEEDKGLIKQIKDLHEKSRQTYGRDRLYQGMKKQGYEGGKSRIIRLMKQAGIQSKMAKRFKVTTVVKAGRPVADNLLQQDFVAQAPNQKWVADLTYIETLEGWLYLAVILDLFSRKVVGMAMSDSLHSAVVIQALEQAIARRKPGKGLWHHSDRGCQYTSGPFQTLLKEQDIICSMSSTGNCFDNAAAESFFHTLKTEHVYFERYTTREEAKASIFEYVEVFYNNQRLHSTLGYKSPAEFESCYQQV